MSDRELLRLAAKAYFEGFDIYADVDMRRYVSRWNPSNDDGDALRLAVKLNLEITPYSDFVQVRFDSDDADLAVAIPINFSSKIEQSAATRLAITMVAAELGSRL